MTEKNRSYKFPLNMVQVYAFVSKKKEHLFALHLFSMGNAV